MRLLLIDDEHEFVKATKKLLELNHFLVDIAYDGEEGLRMAEKGKYDLIILDIMLPKMDGFEVAKKLRKKKLTVRIIMLTAKSRVEDRVKGLDGGADDYLVKPFAIDELLARIRALSRRGEEVKPCKLQLDNLILDPATHDVKRDGRFLDLNNKEYRTLEFLLRNQGKVINRQELGQAVWGKKDFSSNTIDVHMRYLRREIDDKFDRKLIKTVRGGGYRIT